MATGRVDIKFVLRTNICPGCGRTKTVRAQLCSSCRKGAIELGVDAYVQGAAAVRELETRRRREPPISAGQKTAWHGKLHAIAKLIGTPKAELRAAALAKASKKFGREITSSEQLNRAEANWILDRLEEQEETADRALEPEPAA